jgi:uncharacterized membrane protein SpoIIM required for sporulation
MSRQQNFEKSQESWWREIEEQAKAKSKSPELPSLYRRLARQLTLARHRHYDERLLGRLGRMAASLHNQFYRPRSQFLAQARRYLAVDFPRRVREERRIVGLACLLIFGPMVIMTWLFSQYPALHEYVLDSATRAQLDESWGKDHSQNFDDRFMMWAMYVKNNVGIDFQCFGTGLLFGIGSAFYLLFNGIYIGAVAGYVTWAGNGERFWAFVAGHSAPELMAAALAGAAGLRLGMGLLRPGSLPRSQALRESTAKALQLLYGAAFMTFCAAFVEAFWSGFFPDARMLKYVAGALMWVVVLSYLFLGGRRREA